MKIKKGIIFTAALAIALAMCTTRSSEIDLEKQFKAFFAENGTSAIDIDVNDSSEDSLEIVFQNNSGLDATFEILPETMVIDDVKGLFVAKDTSYRYKLNFVMKPIMREDDHPWDFRVAARVGEESFFYQFYVYFHEPETFSVETKTNIVVLDEEKSTTTVKVTNNGKTDKEIELSVDGNNNTKFRFDQPKVKVLAFSSLDVELECFPELEMCCEEYRINADYKPSYCKDTYNEQSSFTITRSLKWDIVFAENGKKEMTVDAAKQFGKSVKLLATNESDFNLELDYSLWVAHEEINSDYDKVTITSNSKTMLDLDVALEHAITKVFDYKDCSGQKKSLTLKIINSELDKLPYKPELVRSIPLDLVDSNIYPFKVNVDSGFLYSQKGFLTLETFDGKKLWNYDQKGAIRERTLETKNGKLFFVTDPPAQTTEDLPKSNLYCLSLKTGKLVWQKDVYKEYYSSEVFNKIGCLHGRESGVPYFWFNIETGEEVAADKIWIIDRDYVVSRFFGNKSELSCMKEGKTVWKIDDFPGQGKLLSTDMKQVFWSSMDNDSQKSKLYKIELETGKVIWERFMFPEEINFFGNIVFVTNTNSKTCDMLDASTGKLIGYIKDVNGYPFICNGHLFLETTKGNSRFLNVYKIVKR